VAANAGGRLRTPRWAEPTSLVLFDVSTLYFETDAARRIG
jgi:hypothetical protein